MITSSQDIKRKFNVIFVGDDLPQIIEAVRLAESGLDVLILPHGFAADEQEPYLAALPWRFRSYDGTFAEMLGEDTPQPIPMERRKDGVLFVRDDAKSPVVWSRDFYETLGELTFAYPNDAKKFRPLFLELEDLLNEFRKLLPEAQGSWCGLPGRMQAFLELQARASVSLESVMSRYLKSRKLTAFLADVIERETGLELAECTALLGALALVSHKSEPMWVPQWSARLLAEWAREQLDHPNITLCTTLTPKLVVVDGGECSGVSLQDGRHIRADLVVLDPDGVAEPSAYFAEEPWRSQISRLLGPTKAVATSCNVWHSDEAFLDPAQPPVIWRDRDGRLREVAILEDMLIEVVRGDGSHNAPGKQPQLPDGQEAEGFRLVHRELRTQHVPFLTERTQGLGGGALFDVSPPSCGIPDLMVLPHREFVARSWPMKWRQLATIQRFLLERDDDSEHPAVERLRSTLTTLGGLLSSSDEGEARA